MEPKLQGRRLCEAFPDSMEQYGYNGHGSPNKAVPGAADQGVCKMERHLAAAG